MRTPAEHAAFEAATAAVGAIAERRLGIASAVAHVAGSLLTYRLLVIETAIWLSALSAAAPGPQIEREFSTVFLRRIRAWIHKRIPSQIVWFQEDVDRLLRQMRHATAHREAYRSSIEPAVRYLLAETALRDAEGQIARSYEIVYEQRYSIVRTMAGADSVGDYASAHPAYSDLPHREAAPAGPADRQPDVASSLDPTARYTLYFDGSLAAEIDLQELVRRVVFSELPANVLVRGPSARSPVPADELAELAWLRAPLIIEESVPLGPGPSEADVRLELPAERGERDPVPQQAETEAEDPTIFLTLTLSVFSLFAWMIVDFEDSPSDLAYAALVLGPAWLVWRVAIFWAGDRAQYRPIIAALGAITAIVAYNAAILSTRLMIETGGAFDIGPTGDIVRTRNQAGAVLILWLLPLIVFATTWVAAIVATVKTARLTRQPARE
jgi:hypothetical protein